jgi:CheY-like chemotaxis protein
MSPILVVEDEESIRKLAVVNLSARGYDVIEVASAEEGLVQLRKQSFSLVLLDIKLPGMQGWDLLAAVARDPDISPGIPVIVMTASAADVQTHAQSYSNIVRILIKPFNIEDLMQVVADTLG